MENITKTESKSYQKLWFLGKTMANRTKAESDQSNICWILKCVKLDNIRLLN